MGPKGILLFCVIGFHVIPRSEAIKVRIGLHPPAVRGDEILPPDEWFMQRLDHFDAKNNQTWKQRYFMNPTWFKQRKTAPVFLFIGGESEADPTWMVQGAWIDYAQQYGALCFQLEHRFYGKSQPTEDMSVESLKFLSSDQALADLANFIHQMKEKHGLTSSNKWVVFGGSYPGSLAAWARMKYPHLIHAAVSSSAPLLAKKDFNEYYDVVSKSLDTYKSGCTDAVKEATRKMIELLKTKNGTDAITDKFSLCKDLDNSKTNDVTQFFESLAGIFADVVQDNENNMHFPHFREGQTIQDICVVMTNPMYGDTIERLAYLNTRHIAELGMDCLNINYDDDINSLRESSWKANEDGDRQWLYQTCTEFGFYQTSEKKSSLFSDAIPIQWYIQMCGDIYGDWFSEKLLTRDISETNDQYGGLGLEVSRVVFVHGSIDPWHALGRIHSTTLNAPAVFIEGTAHCSDMYPAKKGDPIQLKEARKKISKYIGQWLSEGLESQ